MKPIAFYITLFAIVSLLPLPGCGTMLPETKARWQATGSLIAKTAARLAFQTVISAATSRLDGSNKADFLDSASQGLRENMGSIVTGANVAEIVRIWTPAKEGPSHWNELAAKLASAYAKNQTPGTQKQVIEAIATGLQLAAASERQP